MVDFAKEYTDCHGNFEYFNVIKYLLIGDEKVGKSWLKHVLCRKSDDRHLIEPTIGVDFMFGNAILSKNQARLIIWDTSGQERFEKITYAYYRGVVGFIVVFDLTNETSFISVTNKWITNIKQFGNNLAEVILVGNKSDLQYKREISQDRAQVIADDLGLRYFEVSSETGDNVDEMLETLTREVINKIEKKAAEYMHKKHH